MVNFHFLADKNHNSFLYTRLRYSVKSGNHKQNSLHLRLDIDRYSFQKAVRHLPLHFTGKEQEILIFYLLHLFLRVPFYHLKSSKDNLSNAGACN